MHRLKSVLFDKTILKTFKIRLSGRKKKYIVRAYSKKDALLMVINSYMARGWKPAHKVSEFSENCSNIRIFKERKWNNVTKQEIILCSVKYLPAKPVKDKIKWGI